VYIFNIERRVFQLFEKFTTLLENPIVKAFTRHVFSIIKNRSSSFNYLATFALMGFALWIRLRFAPVSAGLQYITLFPAVTLAAIIGGYRAGLLATLIGLAIATYIFTPPYYSFSLSVLETSFWSNLVFLMDGIIVSFSIEGLHQYRNKFYKELQNSIKNHELFIEKESRWKLAIETSGAGLWDWDIANENVYYSPLWKVMVGYSEDELGTGPDEWESRLHSEDKANTLFAVQNCLNGKAQSYSSEHRFLCKDGSYKWMFDRGVVISRSADGKPLRMIGMQIDITDRKQMKAKLQQSEERLRAISDNVSSVMFLKDLAGRYLYINKQYEKLFHVANSDVQGKTDHDIFPSKMADAFVANDQLVAQSGKLVEVEEQVPLDDGIHIYLSVKVPVRNISGEIYAVCGIATDITSLKKTEADQRIAATAFESHEAMMITDANRVIVKINNAFIEESGYLAEEVIGRTPKLLQSGRHDKAFYKAMWESINLTGKWHGEVWDRRKNGEIYPKWLTISAVKDNNGVVINYIGTQYDITERKLAEEKIEELAFFDPLTHLPNRRLLKDRLKQSMIVSNRNKTFGAVLFIDIDHFKKLNDTLGHDKGDILLQHVAQLLTSCVREGDTVGRLGGDEFLVILKNLNDGIQESASLTEAVGTKILNTLGQTYQLGDINYRATASIGATLFCGEETSIEDLLKQADLAMYKSKDTGRNTLHFFDADMEAVVLKRATLENDLHDALQKSQFLLYYQAQIMNGKLTGCEALVRWQHPQRGLVPPNEFIPLAEETGQIIELGRWVLETACAQLASWANQPSMAHLTIAVNVSAHQFHQENFVDQVLETLKNSNAFPYLLKLELTESLLISNIEDIIEKMYKLKAKGVGFSLDDFGTGFSSLSYLKRMPLNQLKIDQSFVRDVLTDPNDASIAKTIITLADSLNLNVIAEGVETAAQRDFLADAGCFAYQGYFFSRPLPIDKFEEFAQRSYLE
jgi:diguanylate cyclase (GGDEF)-like protein/PAS domain S-box-containing protein